MDADPPPQGVTFPRRNTPHENAEGRGEAPIGLPEEGGSNRNDGLGEAPRPLIAEREDRAVGADDATAETKKGVAKLIALAWRRRAKAPTPAAGEGKEGERKEGAPDSAEEARQPDGEPGNPSSVGDNHPAVDDSQGRDGAAVEVAAKSQRPMHKRKGALAVALAAGVAIPAIVVLNWPHSAAQPRRARHAGGRTDESDGPVRRAGDGAAEGGAERLP